jgi:long-chain acyl-CoA synthetase
MSAGGAVNEYVLEERAALTRVAEGRTMCDMLRQAAQRWPDLPAYADRDGGGPWQKLTWAQTRDTALRLAAGLLALGLQPGETVAMMMPNRMEHVLADFAAVHAGAVPVTFYPTLAPDQVAYMAADCDARIVVLDGAAELARWQPVLAELPGVRHVIVRDAAACPAGAPFLSWAAFAALGDERWDELAGAVEARLAAVAPGDPVALLYTSGTTGLSKGVILTHANIMYQLACFEASGSAREHARWVSYLPMAHIAERALTLYLAVHSGWEVYFCPDAAAGLVAVVAEVRPTAIFAVPRVWEKIQAGIAALLAAEPDEARRTAVAAAMSTGLSWVRSTEYGHTTPDELAAEFAAADESVLRPVRSLLGLGGLEIALSGAAPLPPDTGEFFAGLGLRILDLYGMTETTGAFTANTEAVFRLGTVGRPQPGCEVRIADDGEILTRSPLNTPGYLHLEQQTADLLDADGWLHTGDIGTLDDDGFLRVIDRKKELIITAGGENIAPVAIENLLVANPLIGQALAYGDRRPYVVALLALDGSVAPAWARGRGIEAGSLAELAENPQVLEAVGAAVAEANRHLARVQQVKAWRLLPVEWTAESEELTPTLKIKRRVIHAKYADVIDALYGAGPATAT